MDISIATIQPQLNKKDDKLDQSLNTEQYRDGTPSLGRDKSEPRFLNDTRFDENTQDSVILVRDASDSPNVNTRNSSAKKRQPYKQIRRKPMSASISNQTDSRRNNEPINRLFNVSGGRNKSIDMQSEERDSSPMRYSMIDLRNNNGLEDV